MRVIRFDSGREFTAEDTKAALRGTEPASAWVASWRSKRELAPAPPTTDGPSSRGLPLAGASIYSKFRSTLCGSSAVWRGSKSHDSPPDT